MRRIITTGLLCGLMAVAALAADVTGKWTADVPGRGGQTRQATFMFKTDGHNLTGTVSGPRGNELQIEDGKIDDDHLSFTQTMEFNGNTIKFLYKGVVSGDDIHFTRTREGGEGREQEFTAHRAQ